MRRGHMRHVLLVRADGGDRHDRWRCTRSGCGFQPQASRVWPTAEWISRPRHHARPTAVRVLAGLWKTVPARLIADIAAGLATRRVDSVSAVGRSGLQGARRQPGARTIPRRTASSAACRGPTSCPTRSRFSRCPAWWSILYEAVHSYRQIFTDGRSLPKDPSPAWFGYSVGRWERDAFVVDSAGFNDNVWLDNAGRPATERLRVTERFVRRDFGHMDIEITIDDPEDVHAPVEGDAAAGVSARRRADRVHLRREQPLLPDRARRGAAGPPQELVVALSRCSSVRAGCSSACSALST